MHYTARSFSHSKFVDVFLSAFAGVFEDLEISS